MDKKTLKALKQSIAKWKKNAKANHPAEYLVGADDCPLCDLYFNHDCVGCPVYNKTGHDRCMATPYCDAHNAKFFWEDHHFDGIDAEAIKAAKEKAWKAARAEVDFLKSLLPEEDR